MIRLAVLAFLAAVALPAAADGYKLMQMDEVEKRIGQPGFAVFDANDQETWRKHRIPGAVSIAGKRLDGLLPADKATQLLFYCSNPR